MFGLEDDCSAGIYHASDVPLPPFLTEIDSEGTERQAETGCKFNTPKVRPTLKGGHSGRMRLGGKKMQRNIEEERAD